MEPVPLNTPMFALGVGRVLKSSSEKFKEGDLARGWLNWQEYGVHQE